MESKKILFIIGNIVVVAIISWILLSSIDLSMAAGAILSSDPSIILAAVACYLLVLLVTAWRYLNVSESFKKRLSYFEYFKSHVSSIILSDVTPGRVGYAFYPVRQARLGIPAAESSRILGISLAMDFLFRAFALVFLAVVISPAIFGGNTLIGIAFAAVMIAIVASLTIPSKRIRKLLASVPSIGKRLSEAYDSVHSSSLSAQTLFSAFSVSVIGTFLRGLEWLLVFSTIALVPLTFNNAIVFTAIVAVLTGLSFLPISIAGLGVQEGVGASVFAALFTTGLSNAAAAMLAIRAIEVLCDSMGLLWIGQGKK